MPFMVQIQTSSLSGRDCNELAATYDDIRYKHQLRDPCSKDIDLSISSKLLLETPDIRKFVLKIGGREGGRGKGERKRKEWERGRGIGRGGGGRGRGIGRGGRWEGGWERWGVGGGGGLGVVGGGRGQQGYLL